MNQNAEVIVVVQSRLGSTRLPEKGLLSLGGKPVIAHVLATMHQVPAAAWYLATDDNSFFRLAPVAESCGFIPFAGSAEDVLDRFCAVIEKHEKDTGKRPDIIVRATGDNPFLFAEAAIDSVSAFYAEASASGKTPAYFTYTGLPHGSGIEILHVESLLTARSLTDDPYDHEHVGPALYRHQDRFTCIFKPAPAQWNHPELRTTIDTAGDFQRARRLYGYLSSSEHSDGPFSDAAITAAFKMPAIAHPLLFVPSITESHGTGHFRRCVQLANQLSSDLYIGPEQLSTEFQNVLDETPLQDWQLVTALPAEDKLQYEPGFLYSLVVTDQFKTSQSLATRLASFGPVLAIDEGSEDTCFAQYLLDIIPGIEKERRVNASCPECIPLPQNRKRERAVELKTGLVCIGGQDPAGLSCICREAAVSCGLSVTTITKENPIPQLKEQLVNYDLVITHYGFTAFEAVAAGCAVILTGTTPLHEQLAEKYGFVCLTGADLSNKHTATEKLHALLALPEQLYNTSFLSCIEKSDDGVEKGNLAVWLRRLSEGISRTCPVCGTTHAAAEDTILYRGEDRTFRRCSRCGMVYLSWSREKESDYQGQYFFDDYKKQYGKTYLEDFESIKKQGLERCSIIKSLLKTPSAPRILDIGCAYGPFLSAAADTGFVPFGTDINRDAVAWVQSHLGYNVTLGAFPEFTDPDPEYGLYDAVTMWYVIEHLADLDKVLRLCNSLLKDGGVLAFSTPDLMGVTGSYKPETFFRQSPIDHLSLWESRKCDTILKNFGFTVVRVVSTGHHPERFPGAETVQPGSFKYRMLMRRSKKHNLGDTCQIFCIKNGECKK